MGVMKWIDDFEPQNVSFDTMKVPKTLKRLNDYERIMSKELPNLSPHQRFSLKKPSLDEGVSFVSKAEASQSFESLSPRGNSKHATSDYLPRKGLRPKPKM